MWKKAPNSSKNEIFIFGLHSISDDWPSNKHWPKCKKDPLSHWKMKYSFLDYIQFLMISQVIWVTNVDQNAEKGPLSHQKMKCSFLDCDQFLMINQVIKAMNIDQNAKKRPPKSLKNEMFIFGLRSISDNWPSNRNNKCWPKCWKRPPKSLKMKCSFLDYIQFLMIGQVIWVTNIDQNVKKAPKSSKNEMFIFGLHSISDNQPSNPSNECRPKCEKRPPKSLKNEMFVFGLSSISDDQLSDLSNTSWPKCEKRPPKS